MEHTAIADLDPFEHPAGATDGARALSDVLGTEEVALNHYTLEPGDACDGGYHTHLDQEEVFYVLSGAVTFDTEDGERVVETDEVIRFAAGEYHHGQNEGDEAAEVLALGAPGARHDWGKIRVPVACPECEDVDALGVEFGSDGGSLRCPECGTTVG
ncbi:cupin domain-containing protein [Halorientalis litorea]|jgi:uncharacterized cupin superfamily protein|uniref:cupin domain-containing protein n=1 Tax=Halorientalis litorea TaxID=2931977 RepID=UPI001FF5A650|nr:cupin domain-containing protein [Halorientalis litorea]